MIVLLSANRASGLKLAFCVDIGWQCRRCRIFVRHVNWNTLFVKSVCCKVCFMYQVIDERWIEVIG